MKVLVLGGCGAMGTEATRDLARFGDFDEIAVADVDPERARALAQEIGGVGMKVDASSGAELVKLMSDYQVVLNCTNYTFGMVVTEAAIQAQRPLLDLGGLYNTPKQLALTDKAKAAGVTVVLGMGATPGVSNLMSRAAADHMDEVEEVHVHFATYRPMAPSPGLLMTVLDEFSPETRRFFYQNGEFVDAGPFEGEKRVRFADPVGEVPTWFVPHSETHTVPRYFPSVKRVDVRGTWCPEIMAALRNYGQVGLLSTTAGECGVAPRHLLREVFLARPDWPEIEEWAFLVNVEVLGRRGPYRVEATYNLSHAPVAEWGHTATAKVTGIPASIGTQLVARGAVSGHGVMGPDAAFEPWPFFEELRRRKIWISEKVVSTRDLSN